MGDLSRPFVVMGNTMVTRMVLVGASMRAKDVLYFLEQPGTSLMEEHDRFVDGPLSDVLCIKTWMGCFGLPTPKATKVSSPELDALYPLQRKMTAGLKAKLKSDQDEVETTYDFIQDGRLRTTGHKAALKNSQVYPEAYGDAIISSWENWRAKQTDPLDQPSTAMCRYCRSLPSFIHALARTPPRTSLGHHKSGDLGPELARTSIES